MVQGEPLVRHAPCLRDRHAHQDCSAARDIPKAGIVQIGGRCGADVSNSYSLPVNILNFADKILGALDDDQKMALLRFRMMDLQWEQADNQ